jgi:hypothetical protein
MWEKISWYLLKPGLEPDSAGIIPVRIGIGGEMRIRVLNARVF